MISATVNWVKTVTKQFGDLIIAEMQDRKPEIPKILYSRRMDRKKQALINTLQGRKL